MANIRQAPNGNVVLEGYSCYYTLSGTPISQPSDFQNWEIIGQARCVQALKDMHAEWLDSVNQDTQLFGVSIQEAKLGHPFSQYIQERTL